MIKCEICGREFKEYSGLSTHLRYAHNLKPQEYYDTYVIEEDKGLCKICRKPTKFISLKHGYRDTCCGACTM